MEPERWREIEAVFQAAQERAPAERAAFLEQACGGDAELRRGGGLADRYRLERELGRGGMATVYLAHDLKHDRQVALKVLRPELASSLGPERFLREIKLAARLQHPHILAVHDSRRDGRAALVYDALR